MTTFEILPQPGSRLVYALPTKDMSVAIFIAVAAIVGYFFTIYERQPDVGHIPMLGAELSTQGRKDKYTMSAKSFLQRGYEEFNKHNKAFQIYTSEGTKIVLGLKQMEEVKAKPDSVVGNLEPVFKSVMDHYTNIGAPDEVVIQTIKTNLSTQLGALAGALADQTDKCLAADFPSCEDWTPVRVYERLLRVVAAVSTRIFLGEELTTNEEWLNTTIMYTVNIMECAHDIKSQPPWKRSFIYRFLPTYAKVRANEEAAIRLVRPVIQARREAMKRPGFVEPYDMTQWMLNQRVKKEFHDTDYEYMAKAQLQLSFAAIHTTSLALTNMLYDLVAMPTYQTIIRDELAEELAKTGGSWDGSLMHKLQKTDSFMKESQRHNPVGFTAMDRYVRKPFTLSDGTYIPKGVTVTGNTYAICHDREVLQSDSDPNAFDGLRYYTMREQLLKTDSDSKEVAGKHQFVSISQGSLMFGYGKHACPGRFFAGNELKLILVKFLAKFDIKLDEPTRYKNFEWEVTNTVDASKAILMKRIAA